MSSQSCVAINPTSSLLNLSSRLVHHIAYNSFGIICSWGLPPAQSFFRLSIWAITFEAHNLTAMLPSWCLFLSPEQLVLALKSWHILGRWSTLILSEKGGWGCSVTLIMHMHYKICVLIMLVIFVSLVFSWKVWSLGFSFVSNQTTKLVFSFSIISSN